MVEYRNKYYNFSFNIAAEMTIIMHYNGDLPKYVSSICSDINV